MDIKRKMMTSFFLGAMLLAVSAPAAAVPAYAQLSQFYTDKEILSVARGVYADLEISPANNSFSALAGRKEIPESWKVINVFDDGATGGSGLYACVIDTADGNCILAFRGSDPLVQDLGESVNNVAQDWILADVGLVNSAETREQRAAERYAHYIFDEIGDEYAFITITGHSLGGNLSEHVLITAPDEIKAKSMAISIDGPGFSEEYLKARKDEIGKLDGKMFRRSWSPVGSLLHPLNTEEIEQICVPSGQHTDFDGVLYDKEDNFVPGVKNPEESAASDASEDADQIIQYFSILAPEMGWRRELNEDVVISNEKDPEESVWVRNTPERGENIEQADNTELQAEDAQLPPENAQLEVTNDQLKWEVKSFGDAWDEKTGEHTSIIQEQAVTEDGKTIIREQAMTGDGKKATRQIITDPGRGVILDPEHGVILDPVTGEQYSSRTILVSVDQEMTDEMMQALIRKYDLSIMYDYRTVSMYALSASRSLSAEELDALIEAVSAEPHVLSVSKDRVVHLMDTGGNEGGNTGAAVY